MLLFSSFCVQQEEQAAKLKAEKIRVALEKIKEAQVKKVDNPHTHTITSDFYIRHAVKSHYLHYAFLLNFIQTAEARWGENRSLRYLIVDLLERERGDVFFYFFYFLLTRRKKIILNVHSETVI